MEPDDLMDDDMLPEYDITKLKIRRFGPGRTQFGDVVKLEPDVAAVFKTAESVNTILRALIAAMPKTAAQEQSSDSEEVSRVEKNHESLAVSA